MVLLSSPNAEIGSQAPDFSLQDYNGHPINLKSIAGEKGLVVAFICNHCPYVKAIIDRFVEDARVLQSEGIGVVAIMSNDYQEYSEDSPDNMKVFSQENQFSFPYLIDELQEVAKQYGAVCTPDFFGYNAQLELQYRGRLDSAGKGNLHPESQKELLLAMQEISQIGRTTITQHPSMGCSIKWRTT